LIYSKQCQLFSGMVYQPMLDVLAYFRANGFKNHIVSGGGIEFTRPWGDRIYGVPPEQVVGSSIKTKFEMRDGKPVLVRLPEINFSTIKAANPLASTSISAAGRSPRSAIPVATGKCWNTRKEAVARGSNCWCCTTMSANMPTVRRWDCPSQLA
jgi:hypothetical protein